MGRFVIRVVIAASLLGGAGCLATDDSGSGQPADVDRFDTSRDVTGDLGLPDVGDRAGLDEAVPPSDGGADSDAREVGVEPDLAPDEGGSADAPVEDVAADGRVYEPGELELRSREEVCARWEADRRLDQPHAWTPGAGACATGTVQAAAIEDAVRRVNLHRWLVGLPGIEDDPELNRKAQLCAVIMNGLGTIEHYVGEDDPCYTADGAEAARSSNLAWGPTTLADAVDLWVGDTGITSLGHRRWIFNPTYGRGGFGLVSIYSCQWVFDWSGTGDPRYVAYPNPGVAPMHERATWSFSAGSVGFDRSTTVEVVHAATGAALGAEAQILESGFGPDTLAFDPAGWQFEETYEVRVADALENGDRTTIVYRTTPTRCP